MRSIVKRQTSRIDTNLKITTKDGYTVRVKPICFTVKRARTSQIEGIREVMDNTVKERAKELNFEQFVEEAIMGKLSYDIQECKEHISAKKGRDQKEVEGIPVA